MNLLIGLGNPGKKYQKTRHNIGFVVLDRLAEIHKFEIGKNKFKAKFSVRQLFGKDICLIKPQNFMNLSGEVVDSFWNYYKVEPGDVLVIHDDIDLPLGRLKFSAGSGHAGHNGVRSIFDWVYTQDFCRLRIGVGRPPEGIDPADYVLESFKDDELPVADDVIDKAAEAIEMFYVKGFEEARRTTP